MPQISLVINLSERGFSVIRLPVDYRLPEISAEQQIAEPKCGIVCSSGALSDLARALNEALTEVTGQPCNVQIVDRNGA